MEYLEKLKSGNEEGLRYFMSLLGEKLLFFTYKITKNREVAEEIVSESFCVLWQNRNRATSVIALKSFLFLVARNSSYDAIGTYYKKNIDLGDEKLWDAVETKSDILSHIIYTELIEQIILELDKLPKQQAEVFRMIYLEGKNTEEVTETLGTSANAIYYARSKALSTLRQIFKEKDISMYSKLIIFSFLFE